MQNGVRGSSCLVAGPQQPEPTFAQHPNQARRQDEGKSLTKPALAAFERKGGGVTVAQLVEPEAAAAVPGPKWAARVGSSPTGDY